MPRLLPGPDLLRALLQDLPGTGNHFTAQTNYDQLCRRLAREAFVQPTATGGLAYHALIREGCLAHLQARHGQRLIELHRRAAAWFQANDEPLESLYHALAVDYDVAIHDLRARIEAALIAEDWPQAQRSIGVTVDLDLKPEDQAWITFYKAEMAWGEGNRDLAEQRLRRLIAIDLPASLAQNVSERLEAWFDLDQDQEDADAVPAFRLDLFIWWARAHNLPQMQANALLRLGDVARMQDRYGDAGKRLEEALALYRQVEDRLGEAQALQSLGDVARMQDRYDEARQRLKEALALYRQVEDRLGEAQTLVSLGDTNLMQDRYGDARLRLQEALALYRQVENRQGEAHALKSLGEVARCSIAMTTHVYGWKRPLPSIARWKIGWGRRMR